jgi:hypothetical protein
VFDNALIFQLAYNQQRQANKTTWNYMQVGLWEPPIQQPFYLGMTTCYGGRVPSEEEAYRQAEQVLRSTNPDRVVALRLSKLPFGGWLFDRPGLPNILALFYPDDDDHEAHASDFFNYVLPDLALYLHKVDHQYQRGYEDALRVKLEETEHSVATAIVHAGGLGPSLDQLESQLKEIAEAYGEFAKVLGSFERLQATVNINAANLQELFVKHALPEGGPLAAWRAVVARAVEQLQADERFYRATANETLGSLEALQIQTAIKRGQLEEQEVHLGNRRNLILTVIGLILALGQLLATQEFEDFLRWLWPQLSGSAIFPAKLGVSVLIILVGLVIFWGVARLMDKLQRRHAGTP